MNCEQCYTPTKNSIPCKVCGKRLCQECIDDGICTHTRIASKPNRYDSYHTDDKPVKCIQSGYEDRYLFPACVAEGHEQVPNDKAHDCKVVFASGGQCCCYSHSHGTRRD